jgi:hypothetical protein
MERTPEEWNKIYQEVSGNSNDLYELPMKEMTYWIERILARIGGVKDATRD